MRVQLGSERLLDSSDRLDGRRVGVVCNPASIDRGFGQSPTGSPAHPACAARRDLRAAARVPIGRAGEHDRDAARAATTVRRVPVYSLYSETREPTAEMLRGLDVLVIDLQDVGTRIYTYIYTMANCLTRRARSTASRSIVCDRPNPIGGDGGRRADARCPASSRSSACIRFRCATA